MMFFIFDRGIIKMSALLSLPVFVSGPDDKVATVDLYKASGKLINELRDISDQFKATTLDALKGGNTLLDSVKSTLEKDFSAGELGIKLDTDSLIKGLISINPGMVSALRSLPTTLQGELTKVKGFSEIAGTLGGIVSQVSKANLSTVNGIVTMINGISGANLPFNFTDKNGLAQLAISLVIQASKIGIKGVLKPFLDFITDKNILKRIVLGVIAQAIPNNLTDLLRDLATSNMSRALSKSTSGLALQILQNYFSNPKSSISQRYDKYDTTIQTLEALNNSWNEFVRSDTVALECIYMQRGHLDYISDVYVAAQWQAMDFIIPPNLSMINTSQYTCNEAYMYLIGPDMTTSPRVDLTRNFQYINFA